MDTPIVDFVRRYAESGMLRFHMPGHKGSSLLGMEELDITEIRGADSLYEADGIIRASEENASQLFGCHTFYSTEGSSQCIRAMLYLVMQQACGGGERVRILAGRNAHKAFLSACALLDLDVDWIYGGESYLSCVISAAEVEATIKEKNPAAVYLTSPDYLGNVLDVASIAAVCHRHGVLFLVDNAHGAYLKFLQPSLHPMDLGADLCCDSAHKTLPALTGAAYLHLSDRLPQEYLMQAKNALALFGSTSPSYLILQSLDRVNAYLADNFCEKLISFTAIVERLKNEISNGGYVLQGDEPLKVTIAAKARGYLGTELAQLLWENGIECEFSDPDYLVLMLSPENGEEKLHRLQSVLLGITAKEPIAESPPAFRAMEPAMTIRKAVMAPCEKISAAECIGRILAVSTVACPPAVPIVVCGERMDDHAIACFRYYGIECCTVVKE